MKQYLKVFSTPSKKRLALGVAVLWLATTFSVQAKAEELIQLTPEEKESFWSSPFVPATLSFVAPSSGQFVQSQLFSEEPDWFSFGRGVLYLGLLGFSGWQLYDSITRKDNSSTAIWSSMLIGVNILSPVDAFFTANWKKDAAQQKTQHQLGLIYQNAAQLAEKKDYDRAIAQLRVVPESAPQTAVNQQLIKQWQLAKQHWQQEQQLTQQQAVDQKAATDFEQAMATAKQGDFAKAIGILETIPASSKTHSLAQEKIKLWQSILAERQAKALYDEGLGLLKKQQWGTAIAKFRQIPAGSAYYKNAQLRIKENMAQVQAVEAASKTYYDTAVGLVKAKMYTEAVVELKKIPPESSYYASAQGNISALTKLLGENK